MNHLNPVAQPSEVQFEAISDFILNRDLEIPDDALRHTATLLIDTLGVAVGASALEVGHIARELSVEQAIALGAVLDQRRV